MKNTLYLLEMGMDDKEILTDIKNHRIRTIENIDIIYKGKKYNMFFEFTVSEHFKYRTVNKRTGKQLKHPVKEIIGEYCLNVDTEFEKKEKNLYGKEWVSSWRKADLEMEIHKKHYLYNKKNILKVINKYKTGEKFTDICLVKAEAKKIIKKVGGFREIDILGENKDFQTEGGSYFEIGDTWTEDHKIVRCNKAVWVQSTNGKKLEVVDFCEVDLITGKITG